MRERVRKYIERQELVAAREPLWVAVSGGIDSMVLLHLLRDMGHPCHVAHVDHGLRGAGSDADHAFVEAYCCERSIPFRSIKVDVKKRVGSSGWSVQSAARELRYARFNELVLEGPPVMALAHHQDDAIETLFINLMRGMGLHGWETIPVRSGPFVRPLLGERRAAIAAYAAQHHIPFREDASNADPKYLRNRVRHELMPLLESWRPGTGRTLGRSVTIMRELDLLAQRTVGTALFGIAPDVNGTLRIPFSRILESGTPRLILYHALRDVQLHPDRFEDILAAMESRSVGASFPGDGMTVYVDRDELVIARAEQEFRSWVIRSLDDLPADLPLRIETVHSSEIDLEQGPQVAWFDASVLRFPLELRPWHEGDRMRPLGLGGSKLISDILIDSKVPRDRKIGTYVLVSDGVIAWLCGHRIAEGFQARPDSRSGLRCAWQGRPVADR